MLNSIFLVPRVFAVTHNISLLLLWIWNEDWYLDILLSEFHSDFQDARCFIGRERWLSSGDYSSPR
ncbi:hypothetical protein NC651_021490 [Populus alba x Populus x berolinensis]|nr:hypothetical protein NC651_021490 [Populus alba x Populus x berolinensis]